MSMREDGTAAEEGGASLGCLQKEEKVKLDVRLLPGNSVRRKVYPLDTSLERVKTDLESELFHRPLRIPVLDIENCFERKPPSDATLTRKRGSEDVDKDLPEMLLEEKAAASKGAEEAPEVSMRFAWKTTLRDLGFTSLAPAQLFAFVEADFQPGGCLPISVAAAPSSTPRLISRSHVETASQTVTLASRSSQSNREAAAQSLALTQLRNEDCKDGSGLQTAKWKGLFVSTREDRVLQTGRYLTADEMLQIRADKALVIQKYWRRRQAQAVTERLRQEREEAEGQVAEMTKRKTKLAALLDAQRRKRCEDPESIADFSRLLAEVGFWRVQEGGGDDGRNDKSNFKSDDKLQTRRSQRLSLLQREVQLLSRLQELKMQAALRNEREREELLLRQMKQPLVWIQKDGGTAVVHTPDTQRAEDLHKLYLRLRDPQQVRLEETHPGPFAAQDSDKRRQPSPSTTDALLSVSTAERMKTLEEAIRAVERYASAEELRELLQREVALLDRKCPTAFLKGLRRRISREFFRLLLDPAFNPRAAAVTKVAYV